MSEKQKKLLEYIRLHPNETMAEIANGYHAATVPQQTVYAFVIGFWRTGEIEKYTLPDDGRHRFAVSNAVPANALMIDRVSSTEKRPKHGSAPIDDAKIKHGLDAAATTVIHRLIENKNDRMHSWSHCYEFFQQFRHGVTEKSIDLAALHLGFYLASYGMYRGGALLLKRDYRFLVPVIEELIEPAYSDLGVSPSSIEAATAETRAKKLWESCERLRVFLGKNGFHKPSGTLVTKILLGTWCNVPAFDRVFKDAVKRTGMGNATYSQKNFLTIFKSLRQNSSLFQRYLESFHAAGLTSYPAMRVIDAVLWQFAGGDEKVEKGEI